MPITNANQIARAIKLSGSVVPQRFKALVDKMGKGSVIWRFDPMILTDKISIDDLQKAPEGSAAFQDVVRRKIRKADKFHT